MIKALKSAIFIGLIMCGSLSAYAGDTSKYLADFYRAQYDTYLGKEITLEVAFVKPFHCKSSIPELRFFRAMTFDSSKTLFGGGIIVAVPEEEAAKFTKKYGTSPDGQGKHMMRNVSTNKMKGILRVDGKRLFFVDYGGTCGKLIDARKEVLMVNPEEDPNDDGMPGEGPGRHHPGPGPGPGPR